MPGRRGSRSPGLAAPGPAPPPAAWPPAPARRDCSSGPSEERRAGQGIHTVTLHPGLPVVVVDGLLVRVARLVALVAFVQLAVAAVRDGHRSLRVDGKTTAVHSHLEPL